MPVLDPYAPATPYANIANRVSSNFWGAPVVQDPQTGLLSCPGFVGPTYSSRIWDKVFIAVPYNDPSQPYTPGLCEVTCDKARDVDKKKQKGADGARITLAGLEPGMVNIRVTIWTPQQLKEFETLCAIIFPGPQKKTSTKLVPVTTTTTAIVAQGDTTTLGNSGAAGRSLSADKVTRDAVLGPTVTIPKALRKSITTTKSVAVTQPFDVTHPVLDRQGVKSLIFFGIEGPVSGNFAASKTWTLKAIEFLLPKKGTNSTNTPTKSVAKDSTLEDNSGQTPGQNTGNTDP